MKQKEVIPEVYDKYLYNQVQVYFMNIYLEMCKENGDTRDKNEILAEWIEIHSADFRLIWCKNQKFNCFHQNLTSHLSQLQ